jgi:dTDP-4-dehydrorhamnose 3,5-epimerase
MQVTPLSLPEVLILEPQLFGDERGFFFESFRKSRFAEAVGREIEFVQDNHSRSIRNVLRGLHYQTAPHAQGKLVRVISGEIFDVAVDIRPQSRSFGCWTGATLSAANFRQIWVPAGFAHGFVTLSDTAEVMYKTTDYFAPSHERAILWNDPRIAIDWPIEGEPILSGKDATAPLLADARDLGA